MDMNMEAAAWETLPREEKKRRLFLRQKDTLDKFLERGAISQAQYDRSLSRLTENMGETT